MADQNRLMGSDIPSSLGDALYQTGRNALMYPFRNPEATAEFGLSMAPGSGEAMSARDAWNASGAGGNALLAGNYREAASDYGNMLLGVAGAIPGAGIIARGTKRGAAWMDRNIPVGVNRLLDGMMPSDPKNTMFSGAGPTENKPLRAYHGTRSPTDFDTFDQGAAEGVGRWNRDADAGQGFHFSPEEEVASGYGRVGAYDLDMRNPMRVSEDSVRKSQNEWFSGLKSEFDDLDVKDMQEGLSKQEMDRFKEIQQDIKFIEATKAFDTPSSGYYNYGLKLEIDKAKAAGHDSVIFNRMRDYLDQTPIDEYIMFDPSRIKKVR